MQLVAVRRVRRRSRRRNFKVYRERVAERLSLRDDPNVVGNVIITHEVALKRMHRARVSVPSAAVMVRRHVASEHSGAQENPISRGTFWLGIGALTALGVFVVSQLVSRTAQADDALPNMSATGTNFPVP